MDMFPAAPGAGSVYINIHPKEVVVDVFSAADRPPLWYGIGLALRGVCSGPGLVSECFCLVSD